MKRALQFFIGKQLRYGQYFRRELAAIHRRRGWSRAEQRREQTAMLVDLVNKAYRKSPFYRRFYDAHQVDISKIRSLEDIQRLPSITSEHIKSHADELFIGSRLNKIKAHTSGTTGSPMTLYRDYQSIMREGAYLWSHRMAFGYELGMKTVTLRGNLGKDRMESFDRSTNTLYLSSYNLSPNNAAWYYNRILAFQPYAILAYPSSLEILANYFQAMGKSLHVPLSFTSSETVYSYQRDKIEQCFRTKIVDWYGNAERTIALEQNAAGYYDEPPLYAVNEFHADHAITTGLINSSFPLIRYRVDDAFVLEPNTAGREVVKHIQGRSYDYLELPDGSKVGLFCNAMKGINHLKLVQLVQKDPPKFTVNVVTSEDFTLADEQQLVENIVRRVGREAPFEVVRISEDQIIRSESGKFRLIHNMSQAEAREQERIVS